MSTFSGDETVLVFSCKGAAYGMASMGVTRLEPVMKSIMLVVSARDLRIDYRCDHKHQEQPTRRSRITSLMAMLISSLGLLVRLRAWRSASSATLVFGITL
ncbi:unnamed protein product [Musa acuminata subsp. malaccensis]|uniref:(wild Malaysian banana) hypothetical protein n=1 Tax=Musa acuminata subsp. malaccensis TaxID=214687 RepID=A0A804JHZ0_MUSAM|nr:unnamed protein product [Musa acuminata subsp. malaccensis]